jgi:hypothetical protein
MLTEGSDNTLIPVDNWAMFAEKGGIKGQVDWLPLDVVVQALGQLQAHREAVKAQIYELTGISDIVRGASKASETLGAQELKAKFVGIRIQKLQDEVTRFAEEILQIKGEILVKHFDPQILAKMANVEGMTPEDQELVIPALQLLKGNEQAMEWRVTIQADAMAMIDYNQQKTERTEFLTAVATFLQSSSTVGQGAPELIPLMLRMLQFGVAGFKISKDLEGTFDRYIKEFEQGIEEQKNEPPPPDPEQIKAEAEVKAKEQDAMLKQQAQQSELAADAQRLQMEQQAEAARLQMEQQAKQQEMMMEMRKFMMEMQQAAQQHQQEMQMLREEFALKMDMEQQKAAQQAEIAAAKAAAAPKEKAGE